MKDIIGKNKIPSNTLPKHLSVNKIPIFDRTTTAESLNKCFVNVGTDLASKIPATSKSFGSYLKNYVHRFALSNLTKVQVWMKLV